MPPPDASDIGRLGDIIAYGQRALRHLGPVTAEEFISDEKTQDSVVRCLAVVGEAAWKMSDPLKQKHPAIPWMLVAGMRHKLVHDYGAVDLATVYRVLREHLPPLIQQVEVILAWPQPT